MSWFKRALPSVKPGDRFVKIGDQPNKVWVVSRVWDTVDGIAHVRMESFFHQGETRIISVSALTDPRFFLPASPVGDSG
ncbi:hypothetical protein CCC_01738 [Paramagnetospirillum magnetotacticum MS-1]|uniref:Uncharacterized protein n=1 Tax=Paramagnetospirillum magnetotacticum MS-1 TaxID=272627 RepID=A0A0C2Z060_PARME|nr:hypothetical protein [Paramagnetospirillum magnetotacticum]KIM00744.1 hypothetical protein CCC_01738 [Paramagnetospirillum magnetotacticum MS-1]